MSVHTDPPVQNILRELTVEQIDAVDNPQTIQHKPGARYILEVESVAGRLINSAEIEAIRKTFEQWWSGDAPCLIFHRPVRVSVVFLPASLTEIVPL